MRKTRRKKSSPTCYCQTRFIYYHRSPSFAHSLSFPLLNIFLSLSSFPFSLFVPPSPPPEYTRIIYIHKYIYRLMIMNPAINKKNKKIFYLYFLLCYRHNWRQYNDAYVKLTIYTYLWCQWKIVTCQNLYC